MFSPFAPSRFRLGGLSVAPSHPPKESEHLNTGLASGVLGNRCSTTIEPYRGTAGGQELPASAAIVPSDVGSDHRGSLQTPPSLLEELRHRLPGPQTKPELQLLRAVIAKRVIVATCSGPSVGRFGRPCLRAAKLLSPWVWYRCSHGFTAVRVTPNSWATSP